MRRRALCGGAALAVLVGVAGALSAAPSATAATPVTAQVTVAATGGGVVHAGGPLQVVVQVHNPGSTTLPAGRARVGLAQLPPASAATLLERLRHPAVIAGDLLVGNPMTPAVPAGGTVSVRATVPAETLRSVFGDLSGARVLTATLSAADTASDTGASAVTWITGDFTARSSFTTVVPFSAPATASGVASTDQLTSMTDPATGAWSTELDAIRGTDAVVALDPAVQASIRVLGSAAPQQATEFLRNLAALPNEFVPLPYADTDLTLARAAGAAELPTVTSFTGAPTDGGTGSAGASPSATPSASATPGTTAATAAESTRWNYSGGIIGWPAGGSLGTGDLRFLARSDVAAVLIPSSAIKDTAARAAAGPAARLPGADAIVTDATTTRLLDAAVTAATPTARAAPLADLVAILATTGSAPEPPALLATVDRGSDAAALGHVLRVLAQQDWIEPASLAGLEKGRPTHAVSLRAAAAPTARVGATRGLISTEAAGRRLLTAGAEAAEPLLSAQRLELLGVLSNAWRTDPAGWHAAATTVRHGFDATEKSVRFARNSDINYYGNTGQLPIKVQNDLDFPVKVTLHGASDNGRLSVDSDATATLPARSGPFTMLLPVHSISNGEVDLTTTLRTAEGSVIGAPQERRINVAAGWETVGAIVFGAGLAALFATGVYRNVIRRRPRGRRALA